MTNLDFAVRVGGEVKRFISDGTNAAIFAKDGTMQRVTITEPAIGQQSPKVADQDGNELAMARIPKPCSCIGGVWKTRPSELLARVGEALA